MRLNYNDPSYIVTHYGEDGTDPVEEWAAMYPRVRGRVGDLPTITNRVPVQLTRAWRAKHARKARQLRASTLRYKRTKRWATTGNINSFTQYYLYH
jgi:hypothetical protein